jgi:hypothetical protein
MEEHRLSAHPKILLRLTALLTKHGGAQAVSPTDKRMEERRLSAHPKVLLRLTALLTKRMEETKLSVL